jgi:hypothetical protein
MQPSVRVSVKLSAEGTLRTQVKIMAASEYFTNIGPSCMGMVNHHRKFIPNLSIILQLSKLLFENYQNYNIQIIMLF